MRLYNQLFSKLELSRGEQKSSIILIAMIVIATCFRYFYRPKSTTSFIVNSEEIICLQEELDSLMKVELEKRKPKIFPFNPNFISDYKAYRLGMTQNEFNLLKQYRADGKWIHSKNDFKRVTGVSDLWLDSISPFFKFPDWVQKSKNKPKTIFSNRILSYAEKKDLNKSTAKELMTIYGVGEVLSKRIISYRDKLGGYSADVQLYEVYGLSELVVKRIQNQFTVKTPKPIEKLNLNTASASDIATIPGISFEKAKIIWEFVQLREGIDNLSELKNIEVLNNQKIALIELYLYLE